MIFRFDHYLLDTDRADLRTADGRSIPVERQVFRLLALLLENGDVLTTRDEIVESVWDGRAVSDAAVDSRISAARAAIGDDGRSQIRIKTVHGQGFRFVAPVANDGHTTGSEDPIQAETGRPSIAVLPFQPLGSDAELVLIADALPHELILHLSRLHWLTVIARGSTFRFRQNQSSALVGASLDARYVLTGTIEKAGSQFVVSPLLEDTKAGQIVWAERYTIAGADALEMKGRIAGEIVVQLDSQIPLNEALQALGSGTEQLDAWSHYHLGLMRMYRFTESDNAAATEHFRKAVELDPSFARAHAGYSFVRFQDAFTFYKEDRAGAMREARAAAERAVGLDPRDPFANFALGRYHWLDQDFDASRIHLERAVALNPNYAQGLYSLAFTNTISGRTPDALGTVEQCLRLSPLDPLLYGMLGTRALSHLQEGNIQAAAHWGDRAARAPAAHFLIGLIAVATNAIHGDEQRAQAWSNVVRLKRPDAKRVQFLQSFPFHNDAVRNRIDEALRKRGF